MWSVRPIRPGGRWQYGVGWGSGKAILLLPQADSAGAGTARTGGQPNREQDDDREIGTTIE